MFSRAKIGHPFLLLKVAFSHYWAFTNHLAFSHDLAFSYLVFSHHLVFSSYSRILFLLPDSLLLPILYYIGFSITSDSLLKRGEKELKLTFICSLKVPSCLEYHKPQTTVRKHWCTFLLSFFGSYPRTSPKIYSRSRARAPPEEMHQPRTNFIPYYP